jgi:hypothetical protein
MGFKRVKMMITKIVCQMHIRKTMISHWLKKCRIRIKTHHKLMTHQLWISQIVMSQMTRIISMKNTKTNSHINQVNRFI